MAYQPIAFAHGCQTAEDGSRAPSSAVLQANANNSVYAKGRLLIIRLLCLHMNDLQGMAPDVVKRWLIDKVDLGGPKGFPPRRAT